VNDLVGLSFNCFKGRTPNLVSPDDFREACFECRRVAGAVAMNGDGFVVKWRHAARSLVETPNLFLRKRQGRRNFSRVALRFRYSSGSGCKAPPPLYLEQSLLRLGEARVF